MNENMKQKPKKQPRRELDQCSNCGDECHLLAGMIDEHGDVIYLCEECLRDSE